MGFFLYDSFDSVIDKGIKFISCKVVMKNIGFDVYAVFV